MTDEVIDMDNPFGMPEFKEGDDPLERALECLLNMPEGRAFIWAVLAQTKIYDETFSGNSADIFEKGRRSVGLWLIAQMTDLDPTAYPRLLLDVARQGQRAMKLAEEQEMNR